MPQASLPKLAVFTHSHTGLPTVIYGTQTGLKTLVAAIQNVLSEHQPLTTQIGSGNNAHFQIGDCVYQIETHICTEDFMATLPTPFCDGAGIPIATPEPALLPAVMKMWRHVEGMVSVWPQFGEIERAYRVIKAYEEFNIRNRVCPQMLLAAMRKMPSWFQSADCHLAMSKAINAVIDVSHPDTLVLRTELDAANVIIADLKRQLSDLVNEEATC